MSYTYICILDFEATCEEDAKYFDNEIIEFPSVLLKLENEECKIVSEFQHYCKPLLKPIVSKFCEKLTGITQEIVNNGNNFPDSLKAHHNWLSSYVIDSDVIIVTCGNWDIAQVMPSECKKWNIIPPTVYRRFININDIFLDMYKIRGRGMVNMLNFLNINLEGRHHSGIDDCRNIASIFRKIISDGYILNNNLVINVDIQNYQIEHKNSDKEIDKTRLRNLRTNKKNKK